jgi:DNA-binding MarR family transcriptional regulator
MPKPVNPPAARATTGSAGIGPAGLAADTFETSRLLLELVHVAHAMRAADVPPAGQGAPGHRPAAPSPHAVRAAIHVYQHGDRTIGELASGLGVSYGWASRIVSELEATAMLRREPDARDRRVTRVSLTPAATEMVERAYRWRGEAVERALEDLDDAGRRAVVTFLRHVTRELAAAAEKRRSLAG